MELINANYFGSFQLFNVTFYYLSLYVGILFAALYALNAYHNGAPTNRYLRDRSVVAQVPFFLLLDIVYPWVITLLTFFWSPPHKTSAYIWKSVSALWIFTAVGWVFRGTIFDVYYMTSSWWRGPSPKPADRTTAKVVEAASPAVDDLHSELSQLAVDRFLAVFNVLLILVTFPLTFPTSDPFIQLLESLFGHFTHPIEEDS